MTKELVTISDVSYYGTRVEKEDWRCVVYTARVSDSMPEDIKETVTGKKCSFTATGAMLPQDKSIKADLTGVWQKTKYGTQFKVTTFTIKLPSTEEEILNYLTSPAVKGIGKVTAKRVVEHFGKETLQIISNDIKRLLEVPGIRADRLDKIKESVGLKIGYQNLQALLSPAGISADRIMAAFKEFGDNAAEKVKKNPYILMDVKGIGFVLTDRVARILNVGMESYERITAALQAAARYLSQERGDIYHNRFTLVNAALNLLNSNNPTVIVPSEKVEASLQLSCKDGKDLINRDPGGVDPIFLPEYDQAEYTIANAAVNFIRASKKDAAWEKAVEEWQNKNPEIALTKGQEQAVLDACENRLLVVTGGAGTGKTTVAKVIINTYRAAHKNRAVHLLAPTGKAARRLSEATGEYACTIHSALKMQSGSGFLFYQNTLDQGLVVVDEVSMVDIFVMQALLSAVADGSTIVLLGDVNQLPSVGPGACLQEFIRSEKVKVARLSEIMRQGKESLIITNATRINNGDCAMMVGEDFQFVQAHLPEAQDIVLNTYLQEVSRIGMDNVCVLSPLRKWGDLSTITLNRVIQERANSKNLSSCEIIHGTRFTTGDKVIQTRNTDEASNGDVGYINAISSELNEEEGKYETMFRITFESGVAVKYSRKEMEDVDLAYALTIHKSQGSEYQTVIIPLLKEYRCPLYKRNLLYTAVTRAKKKVILIGSKEAVDLCIHTPDTGIRNTMLADRIYLKIKHNL